MSAGVGNGTWGNLDGTIDVNGRSLPSPTRYAVVQQDLLLFHPTVGVGWSPVECSRSACRSSGVSPW